jgi:P27 family predicted phage terminase small subunit
MSKRIKIEINKDLEKETQDYIYAVNKFLRKKNNGVIADEWLGALEMLTQNYDMFIKCRNKIKEDGLMIDDRFGGITKHPLIKVQQDAQIQCLKIIGEFGLSLKSNLKLSIDDSEEKDEDSPLMSFVKKEIEKR